MQIKINCRVVNVRQINQAAWLPLRLLNVVAVQTVLVVIHVSVRANAATTVHVLIANAAVSHNRLG